MAFGFLATHVSCFAWSHGDGLGFTSMLSRYVTMTALLQVPADAEDWVLSKIMTVQHWWSFAK